jgi:photosystem II stability/assembly factor-like uncharacterized protein
VIELDPTDPKRVFAGSVAGLYVTADSGKSWARITDDTKVVNAIGIAAARPARIILATEGDGIYVSTDQGASFHRSSEGMRNVRATSVVADPVVAGRLYAAVVNGNAASGVYESTDAGESWSRINESPIPEILTLAVQTGSEARFVAGTDKGFFYSEDGKSWLPAKSPLLPVRVEKIVRYSEARMFAATTEGVYTSKDGGRGWYRLKDSYARVLDITVGTWKGGPALYALSDSGFARFDGAGWQPVEGTPAGARSVFAGSGKEAGVLIFGTSAGARAGIVDETRWTPLEGSQPLAQRVARAGELDRAILSTHESSVLPFSGRSAWSSLRLPVPQKHVLSIASDPFVDGRLYLATNGAGIFVWGDNGRASGAAAVGGAR